MATLLLDENLNYFYSELNWNHAPTGKNSQGDKWIYVTREQAQEILKNQNEDIDVLKYPNEYIDW
jgi:hypothetical protein